MSGFIHIEIYGFPRFIALLQLQLALLIATTAVKYKKGYPINYSKKCMFSVLSSTCFEWNIPEMCNFTTHLFLQTASPQ
jgi:hypothetical protein